MPRNTLTTAGNGGSFILLGRFLLLILVTGAEAAGVLLIDGTGFLPLVFLGGVVIAWMWTEYGGWWGAPAIIAQLSILALWYSQSGGADEMVAALGLAWWGTVSVYLYASGRENSRRIEELGWRKLRLDGDVNSLEGELERKKRRLENSRHWLNRLGGLVNLAEELLPAYRPSMLARALETGVPELLPPADRFYLFRQKGKRLEPLASRVPEEENSPLTPDDLDRHVMEEMKPVIVEDASVPQEEVTDERSIGSIIASPLTARILEEAGGVVTKQALGLVRVEAMEPHVYGRTDLEILNVIADLAARGLLNADLYERTEQLAVRDGLTGLFLRQVFYERAAQDISRARREGAQVCLAILDIDDFKHFNDNWGHSAGDLVLRRVASIIADEAAPGEIACRYGGEELALFMHQDVSRAGRRVEKILKRAEGERYVLPDEEGNLQEASATLSAGLAAFPLHAEELVSLIRQADRALYRAKRMGKNRLIVARSR